MHDPVNMLIADTYARRHGFKDFLDAQPLELLKIIVEDVRAIRDAMAAAGYRVSHVNESWQEEMSSREALRSELIRQHLAGECKTS